MTVNDYTHDGVRYLGLTSYNFGEMLYSWTTMGYCSLFVVSRTPFCIIKYKNKSFKTLLVRARSKVDVIAHTEEHINQHIDEGLKTYSIKQVDMYGLASKSKGIEVDLCKIKEPAPKKRRIILL